MNIPALGPLQPEKNYPDWLLSQPVSVPCFDGQPLVFTLTELTEADAADVQNAVAAFLALGPDARLAASPYVFQDFRDMAEAVGEEDVGCEITSPEGAWARVRPTDIYATRRYRRDRAIYVQVVADCDWEEEHALQLVYRRGSELSRVSSQDGHLTHTDSYALPKGEDRING